MSRMSLSEIHRSRTVAPLRLLIQGQEGVGKSTFAAGSPLPIFLAAEDGLGQLDVPRFPQPTTWIEVQDALRELDKPHAFKTLVVDTVDWLEALVHRHVCQMAGKPNIEAFGWGKGYNVALDQWRVFLSLVERLHQKGMGTIFLAHTKRKLFSNPAGDDYERFQMKLHAEAGSLLREWVDVAGFACYEVLMQEKDGLKAKAYTTGDRVLYTKWSTAYDAKQRFALPDPLPLDWATFADAVEKARGPSDETIKRFEALIAKLPDAEARAKAAKYLAENRTNPAALRMLDARLTPGETVSA